MSALEELRALNQARRRQRLAGQKTHWQALNAMARVVGGGFTIGGFIFSVYGLSLLLDSKATINMNGVPSSDPWEKAITLAAGIVVLVAGVLLILARPCRPDLEAAEKRPSANANEPANSQKAAPPIQQKSPP